jgi:hypothetical protein
MKKLYVILLVIIFGCASFLTGCVQDEEEDGVGISEGTLRLHITDKPADLDILYANVTISMVQVHKSGADVNETDDDEEENGNGDNERNITVDAGGDYEGYVGEDIEFLGNVYGGVEPYNWTWDFGDDNISYDQNPIHNYSSIGIYNVNLTVRDSDVNISWDEALAEITEEDNNSDAGWYTIVNQSQTFDLIALQNATDVLGEKNLSAGKYTQIRLTVESALITINNSGEIEVHNLTIPSNKVKLIKPFWIYENETTVLTLDFDVYKSVHKTGSNKYMMKPTIKIIQ